jgi:hypothetical protein
MLKEKTSVGYSKLPKSATNISINIIGLISFCIVVYIVRKYNINNFVGAILSGLAICVPIIVIEFITLKVHKRKSTGLDFSIRNTFNLKRVLIKLLGLYVTLAVVAFIYWVFPEYHAGFYQPYWNLVKWILPIIIIGSVPYFFFLDRYMVEPEEVYWKVGMMALGKRKVIDKKGLKNHSLGWVVKLFFLPLMFVFLTGNINHIKSNPFYLILEYPNFDRFYGYMFNYLYTIDLAWVFVGYLLTLRIFDSHIRTVEPSFLGWFAALQCYQPFNGLITGSYFKYDNGYFWGSWLAGNHTLFVIWGSIILSLIGIYVWASLTFGIRFSNLTHRGILTNGPYSLMKHPAYVSKNISWWMISIPFISSAGFIDALQHCLLLFFFNIIYFLRARTEERHLSQDSTYVQYATVMNSSGIFSGLYKRLPFLGYNAELFKKNALL